MVHNQYGSWPEEWQLPPTFWDNLSNVWLTQRTLEEFNRRIAQSSPHSYYSTHYQRPLTRRIVAEWKNRAENWMPTQSATHFLTSCSAGPLQKIRLSARHGGPNLSEFRGYQRPVSPLRYAMNSLHKYNAVHQQRKLQQQRKLKQQRKQGSAATMQARNTSLYDRNFEQHLIDHGIYPWYYIYLHGQEPVKPDNRDEIIQRLAQHHRSLPPATVLEKAYWEFVQSDGNAKTEDQMKLLLIPMLEGKIESANHARGAIAFKNLDDLTDGTLMPGNPDRYSGAPPEALNQHIHTQLSGQIIPTTQGELPILPNFFLAMEGPDATSNVLWRQALYNGTLGARGIQSLQSYRQNQLLYDSNAYTITSTYHNSTLTMYTIHPTPSGSPGSEPKYHMIMINSWSMNSNAETFRQGITAYRNASEWAEEQRDNLIRQANERANKTGNNEANNKWRSIQTPSVLDSNPTTRVSTAIAATSLHIAGRSENKECTGTSIQAVDKSEPADSKLETSMDGLDRDMTSEFAHEELKTSAGGLASNVTSNFAHQRLEIRQGFWRIMGSLLEMLRQS